MGYYIEGPRFDKVVYLEGLGAVRVVLPKFPAPEGEALICIVHNPGFDAAALIYSESEFDAFSDPEDIRPKSWLHLDKAEAHRLAGYEEEMEEEMPDAEEARKLADSLQGPLSETILRGLPLKLAEMLDERGEPITHQVLAGLLLAAALTSYTGLPLEGFETLARIAYSVAADVWEREGAAD